MAVMHVHNNLSESFARSTRRGPGYGRRWLGRWSLAMMAKGWKARSAEDKRCFDIFVDQVKKHPLDAATIRSLRQKAPPAPKGIGAILAGMGGWFHGGGRAP